MYKKIFPAFFFSKDEFHRYFDEAILKSEKLRTRVLSGLFFLVALFFAVISFVDPNFFPKESSRIFGMSLHVPLAVIFFVSGIYEGIVSFVFNTFLKKGMRLPAGPKYVNAAVEVTIPSAVLFFAVSAYGVNALYLPTVLFYFVFIALSVLRLSPALSAFTGLVAALEYVLLIFIAGEGVGPEVLMKTSLLFMRGVIILSVGLVTAFVAHQVRRRVLAAIETIREKNRIREVFGQHVSPSVVDTLLNARGEIVSDIKDVCVMFLDIRNFTGFSEDRPPQAIVEYLNTLFDFMIEIINRHGGIINKFLGDGFMAVFGAPGTDLQSCENGVSAAIEINSKVEDLTRDGSIYPTTVGIGLHYGPAVTGEIGTSLRREYTVIGDVVNTASRVEALNKKFGSRILVTQTVYDNIDISGENLGPVEIRGLAHRVNLYRIR